ERARRIGGQGARLDAVLRTGGLAGGDVLPLVGGDAFEDVGHGARTSRSALSERRALRTWRSALLSTVIPGPRSRWWWPAPGHPGRRRRGRRRAPGRPGLRPPPDRPRDRPPPDRRRR